MWQFMKRLLGLGSQPQIKVDVALIDQLVAIASPRIKMADRYPHRLAPLLAHACAQLQDLGQKLPPPVPMTAEAWRHDLLLGLAFANPERMALLAGHDERIRQWFRMHPLADKAFAILAMSHVVERRFGVEEHEGMVRQDVPQEVLVLREHRFGEPVASDAELVRQAQLRALEELAHHAARRIQGLEADRDLIESEISTLRIALRLGGSTDPLNASSQQRARQKRLDDLQQELVLTRRMLEPRAQLDTLCAALQNPGGQLRYTDTEIRVDSMGVLRKAESQGSTIRLVEIEMVADVPVRRVLLPVEIPRNLIQREDGGSGEASLYSMTSF